jgi:hypothetical protein
MNGTMLIFKPGAREPEVRRFTRALDLGDLKDGIGGGWLEKVPGFGSIEHEGKLHQCIALADEKGKLNHRSSGKQAGGPDATNDWATLQWDAALRRAGHPGLLTRFGNVADYLVGQIAVIYGDVEFMETL